MLRLPSAPRRCFVSAVWLMAVILLGSPLSAQSSKAPFEPPRPLSEAEAQAARWVALYLSSGAAAWQGLWTAEAIAESLPGSSSERLELVMGPPSGAVWRLATAANPRENEAVFEVEYPSGADELVYLTVDLQAPSPLVSVTSASTGESVHGDTSASQGSADEPADQALLGPMRKWIVGLWVASVLLLLLSRLDRKARVFLLASAGACALVSILLLSGVVTPPGEAGSTGDGAEAGDDGEGGDRPADLLALRRAVAMGEAAAVRRATERLRRPDALPAVLWRAEHALLSGNLTAAQDLLDGAAASAAGSLKALRLRAEIALQRGHEIAAGQAQEQLVDHPRVTDRLLLEAAETFALFELKRPWEKTKDKLSQMGARAAAAHYHLARAALVDDLKLRGAAHFRQAWQLNPLPRSEWVADVLLAVLVTQDRDLRQWVNLGEVRDPERPCSQEPSRFPGAGSAESEPWISGNTRTLGDLLLVRAGTGRLEVAGGCGLAGDDAVSIDAETWREERDAELLSHAAVVSVLGSDEATPTVGTAEGDTRAWPRAPLRAALEPLERAGRWGDLARLASYLAAEDGPSSAAPDPSVTAAHARALERLGRPEGAAQKLISLAQANRQQSRVDPTTLFRLADILVRAQEYDRALALIKKGLDSIPYETSGSRLLQVEMEKRLFRSSREHRTEHFRIVYPPSREVGFAQRAGRILEAERRRLRRLIPVPGDAPTVDVLLLEVDDFYSSYAGMQILGLYDGRVRLPLGSIRRFDPFAVSIMTHELAHALIDQATGGLAPHWFHEGLAQHVEMPQQAVNPFPALEKVHSRLSLPLLVAAMESRATPGLSQIGYDQSRWTLHYLVSTHGVGAVRGLLNAFRNGLDTEQAVEEALGLSLGELDRRLMKWALGPAPEFWPSKVKDYEPEGSPLVSRNP